MDAFERAQTVYNQGTQKFDELKKHFLYLLPYWIAGTLTALAATSYSKIFVFIEKISENIYEYCGFYFLFIPPLLFIMSWWLVEKFAPKANGSGIPQLMASVELVAEENNSIISRFLGFRIIIIKVLSSLLSLLGGGAIGREGPTLQISGSIFYLVQKYWKRTVIPNHSAFLLAGAASGLASAFNTPLGGIVYVIEELAKSHLNSFRTGVVHSVICAGVISQMLMGPYIYFGVPKTSGFEMKFLIDYIFIAILAGLLITLFAQSLKALVNFRSQLNSLISKIVFAGLMGVLFAAVIMFISSHGMGAGKNLLTQLLSGSIYASTYDVIARFLGTFLTYANGGAGGIFAPTLSMGGSLASLIDQVFSFNLGPLAVLVGMSAGLAALTHSPLTSFILVLEMTDRHNAIFPLMLAAIIGHGLSKFISKTSFYEFVCAKIIREIIHEKNKNEISRQL